MTGVQTCALPIWPFYLAVIFTLLTGGAILVCHGKPHIRLKDKISKSHFAAAWLEAVLLLVYAIANVGNVVGSAAVIYHLFLFHPLIRCKLKNKSIYHTPLYGISILLNLSLIFTGLSRFSLWGVTLIASALIYVALSIVRLISCLKNRHLDLAIYKDIVFALLILLPIIFAIQISNIISLLDTYENIFYLISLFMHSNFLYYAILL